MAVRVAINGFGRIGRCLTRLMATTDKDLELVAINSRADIARDIHLFKYDSVHGRFTGTVAAMEKTLFLTTVRCGLPGLWTRKASPGRSWGWKSFWNQPGPFGTGLLMKGI